LFLASKFGVRGSRAVSLSLWGQAPKFSAFLINLAGCWRGSHYILIPGSSKEEEMTKGISLLFRDASYNEHTLYYFYTKPIEQS
jgi:hypothetical protein